MATSNSRMASTGGVTLDAVQLRIAVVGAVQQEIVRILARAVDVDGERAAHRSGRALRRRHDAGQQQAELIEIAPIEGQADDLRLSITPPIAEVSVRSMGDAASTMTRELSEMNRGNSMLIC